MFDDNDYMPPRSKKNRPAIVTVRIKTVFSKQGDIIFDLIDSDNYVKRFKIEKAEITNSERFMIQKVVDEYVQNALPPGASYTLRIVFL